MRSHGRHVAGLIEEPDPLPFIENVAEVLGRKEQLFRPHGRIARIDRKKAANVGEQRQTEHSSQHEPTHRTFLHERPLAVVRRLAANCKHAT